METIEKAEFTNKHNDQIELLLMADSFGGYHLILKAKRLRKHEEQRFWNMSKAPLSVVSFTEETTHTYTEIREQAISEFKMTRAMEGDPDYSMIEFFEWQKLNGH